MSYNGTHGIGDKQDHVYKWILVREVQDTTTTEPNKWIPKRMKIRRKCNSTCTCC